MPGEEAHHQADRNRFPMATVRREKPLERKQNPRYPRDRSDLSNVPLSEMSDAIRCGDGDRTSQQTAQRTEPGGPCQHPRPESGEKHVSHQQPADSPRRTKRKAQPVGRVKQRHLRIAVDRHAKSQMRIPVRCHEVATLSRELRRSISKPQKLQCQIVVTVRVDSHQQSVRLHHEFVKNSGRDEGKKKRPGAESEHSARSSVHNRDFSGCRVCRLGSGFWHGISGEEPFEKVELI